MYVNEQKGAYMKKISIMAAVCALITGAASADFQPNTPQQAAPAGGGFVGGTETIVTVKQVKEMRDDVQLLSRVTLFSVWVMKNIYLKMRQVL